VTWHRFEALVQLFLAINHRLLCPLGDMLSPNTLVKLVKQIRGDGAVDITVREVCPEGIDGLEIVL
jgi:hypothetical protein